MGEGGADNGSWPTGGDGGASDSRGGAGGAGYAGGTGGSATNLLITMTNIGGGGGGSSFIASSVTPTSKIADDTSGTGGSMSITFIDGVSAKLDEAAFSATISDYFTIESVTKTDDQAVLTQTGNTVSCSNLHLNEKTQTITLILSAKYTDSFRGGNKVPLLLNAGVTVNGQTRSYDNSADNLFDTDDSDDPDSTVTDFANVPLSYDVKTQNVDDGTHGSKTIEYLYESLNHYTTNTFITGLAYSVYSGETKLAEKTTLAVGTYVVVLTVTPDESQYAVVGTPVSVEYFYGISYVSDEVITEYAGPPGFQISKSPSYDEATQQYTLAVSVAGNATGTVPAATEAIPESEYPAGKSVVYSASADPNDTGYVTDTYTVQESGYYYIQAWGGNGGRGQGVMYNSNEGGDDYAEGGDGGAGGYLGNYVYLVAGDTITIEVGKNGTGFTPAEDVNTTEQYEIVHGTPGGGGYKTTVSLTTARNSTISTSMLMISGGGGGGGSGWRVGTMWGQSAHFGQTAYNSSAIGLTQGTQPSGNPGAWYDLSSDAESNAGNGSNGGTGSWSRTRGNGGAAGGSYMESTTYLGQNKDTTFTLSNTAKTKADNKSDKDYTNVEGGAVVITCLQLENATRPVANTTGIANKVTELANLICSYNITAEFTPYFSNFNVSGTYTYEESSGEAAEAAALTGSFTPTATWADNTVTVSGIGAKAYTDRNYEVDEDSKVATVKVNVYYTVRFTFKRAEGFIGGNDVPVLKEAAEGAVYGNMALTLTSGETTTSLPLKVDNAADYANVPIIYDLSQLNLASAGDKSITAGTTLTEADIYTYAPVWPEETAADFWKYRYVKLSDVVMTPSILKPMQTTTYTVTAGIEPTAYASKAKVADAAMGQSISVNTTVTVGYSVTVKGAGAGVSGYAFPAYVDAHQTVSGTLTAGTGKKLTAVTVSVGGNDVTSQCTYSLDSGAVTVPGSLVNGNVVISGTTEKIPYDLTFIIVGTDQKETEWEKVALYYGDDISSYLTEAQDYAADQNDPNAADTGYEFSWVNLPESTTMPAGLTIYGGYVPKQYPLTINYVVSDGEADAPKSYTGSVYYNTEYSVESPVLDGYIADHLSVSGTMSIGGETVTVTYNPIPAGLTVVFVYADTGAEITRINKPGNVNDELTVAYPDDYPSVPGHTPDIKENIVKKSGEGDKLVTVKYSPNQGTVRFLERVTKDDGTTEDVEIADSRTVVYGKTYGQGSYLPAIGKEGHTFVGWFTDPEGGTQVTEETPVSELENGEVIDLYARYTINSYNLVINYLYRDGTVMKDAQGNELAPHTETVVYQGQYSVASPVVTGYTADYLTVSGEMPAYHQTITVTYNPNPYTLTILPLDPFGKALGEGTYTYDIEYGEEITIDLPDFTGYTPADYPNGTLTGSWTGDTQKAVSYTIDGAVFYVTVEWGDLTFDYSQGKEWNGNAHQYHIPAATTGTNYVKVTNQPLTRAPVFTTVYFDPNEAAYPNMSAEFSIEGETNRATAVETISGYEIGAGLGKTYWLWLYGSLTTEQANTNLHTVGECVVQISATNPNQQETQGG